MCIVESKNADPKFEPALVLKAHKDEPSQYRSGIGKSIILGSLGQDRIIVAILSSTFSVVTVLLARVFIKEPVSRNQWLAIFIIVIGVAIISAESYSH